MSLSMTSKCFLYISLLKPSWFSKAWHRLFTVLHLNIATFYNQESKLHLECCIYEVAHPLDPLGLLPTLQSPNHCHLYLNKVNPITSFFPLTQLNKAGTPLPFHHCELKYRRTLLDGDGERCDVYVPVNIRVMLCESWPCNFHPHIEVNHAHKNSCTKISLCAFAFKLEVCFSEANDNTIERRKSQFTCSTWVSHSSTLCCCFAYLFDL